MSAQRAALFLVLFGSATCACAEQITCASHDRVEACTTVLPGSRVRMVEQLSSTPCVEGRTWSFDTNLNSLWTSGGCRARFDVQPPPTAAQSYDNESRAYENESRGDVLRSDVRNANWHSARPYANMRDACIDQAVAGQAFGPDQVDASDARRIDYSVYAINLDTPNGPLTCTVSRDGRVRSLDDGR